MAWLDFPGESLDRLIPDDGRSYVIGPYGLLDRMLADQRRALGLHISIRERLGRRTCALLTNIGIAPLGRRRRKLRPRQGKITVQFPANSEGVLRLDGR